MFIAALFTIPRTWKQPRCPLTEERIKMWYIYTMGYYSAIKKKMPLSQFYEVDESRACYTEWIKSEREKQMYINTYIWNLEKWYWWTYLQGRNGDADIRNRLLDTVGEGESERNGESRKDIYKLPCVK